MLELLPIERHLFLAILIVSLISSSLGCVQILRDQVQYRRLLVAFASLQVTLGAVLLIFRAVTVHAFPITGVFESMLILIIFVGITFLFLSAFIHQVWFLSVMAWVLTVMIILSAFVAKPAAELEEAARTPWVIVHALSMALAAAMIVFGGAMSILFLWARMCLKNNQFVKLFGKMPTVERLQALNLMGLQIGFIALTFGLFSGIGLVAVSSMELGMTLRDWLTDSKIVLIGISWILLLVLILLRKVLSLSGKAVAQATLVLCFLILFAFIGSKIFCKSDHDFIIKPGAGSHSVERFYADHTHRH